MDVNNLRELFIDELKDLYNAEKQLVRALPKMAKSSNDPRLQKAFSDHLAQTEGHVERLERVFDQLGTSPRGKKCKGMEGLIEEAKELLGEDVDEDVLDAGIIAKAQRVEHYEIAGYGTARTFAQMLGETEAARLLEQTLNEEKQADELLTQLAESSIDVDAMAGASAASSARSRSDREVSRSVASERRGGATPSRTNGRTRSTSTTRRETRTR